MPASPARPRLGLLDFRPHAGAHRVALRAGVSVLVPLLVIAAIHRPEWTMYAAFGAFTSLYGLIGAVVGVVVVLAAHRLRRRRAVGR